MAEEKWVLCPKCGRKLAKDKGGVIEIVNGRKAARIYGALCVALDCDRCGKTFDIPAKLVVAEGKLP